MTVITTILKSRIKKFVYEFNDASREIYADENGKLRHPGEFGGYRESVVANLLKPYIPKKYDLADGFFVDSEGNVSTQCDIAIFSGDKTCFIESDNHQKFFISQSVVIIGEVKSTLTSKQLKEALIKLAKNKELRLKSKGHNSNALSYKEQPLSFLICEEIKTSSEKMKTIFNDVYSEFPESCRHNIILSLKDGLFSYYTEGKEKNTTVQYPTVSGAVMKNLHIVSKTTERNVQLFCSYIKQHLETYKDEKFEFLDHLSKDDEEKLNYLE